MVSLARYESFLINNVSTISTLESSLKSMTWFLPGRIKDAELMSEALSALLSVVSMYHDTLLAKIIRDNPKYKPLIPSSLHTRYTQAWSEMDSRYKWASRILELLRYTELLIEMGLRRLVSVRNRWRGIVLLESIKFILRFHLLRLTKRPILSPPTPERDFDPALLPPSATSTPTLAPSSPTTSLPATPEHLKNNHVPLEANTHPLLLRLSQGPPSDTCVEDFLLSKALTTSRVKVPTALVNVLVTPKEWLSEIVYMLRPLVYVTLLISDRRSNRPLITAILMEIISRNLRRTPPISETLECSEYARRDRNIFWYLLRGSIWQDYTKLKLEAFIESTANTPLLSLIGLLLKSWMPLIDEYHYYTAP